MEQLYPPLKFKRSGAQFFRAVMIKNKNKRYSQTENESMDMVKLRDFSRLKLKVSTYDICIVVHETLLGTGKRCLEDIGLRFRRLGHIRLCETATENDQKPEIESWLNER
jgi:hypothetical protein